MVFMVNLLLYLLNQLICTTIKVIKLSFKNKKMDSDLNYLYKTFSNQSKNCVATRFVFVVFVLKLNLLVAADFDVSRKVV
jgi:hypothetical protein